jgi:hypothetical protein
MGQEESFTLSAPWPSSENPRSVGGRHDIRQNDINHNGTQHNNTEHLRYHDTLWAKIHCEKYDSLLSVSGLHSVAPLSACHLVRPYVCFCLSLYLYLTVCWYVRPSVRLSLCC